MLCSPLSVQLTDRSLGAFREVCNEVIRGRVLCHVKDRLNPFFCWKQRLTHCDQLLDEEIFSCAQASGKRLKLVNKCFSHVRELYVLLLHFF